MVKSFLTLLIFNQIIFFNHVAESHVMLVNPEQGWFLRLPSITEKEVVDVENIPAMLQQK